MTDLPSSVKRLPGPNGHVIMDESSRSSPEKVHHAARELACHMLVAMNKFHSYFDTTSPGAVHTVSDAALEEIGGLVATQRALLSRLESETKHVADDRLRLRIAAEIEAAAARESRVIPFTPKIPPPKVEPSHIDLTENRRELQKGLGPLARVSGSNALLSATSGPDYGVEIPARSKRKFEKRIHPCARIFISPPALDSRPAKRIRLLSPGWDSSDG